MSNYIKINDYFKMFPGEIAKELEGFKFNPKACELCGNDQLTILRPCSDAGCNTLINMPVCGCEKCGYVQQGLESTSEFYDLFYKSVYAIQQERSSKNKELEMVKNNQKTIDGVKNIQLRAQNLLDYLYRNFPYINDYQHKRLLDVGCGNGGFMKVFQENGWFVDGNDPDPTACSAAKRYLNLDVENIPAESMSPTEEYDLIIIIGSLEHCKDPKEVLQKCYSCLKDTGLIIVEGRYFPIGRSTSYLNFNHHRFLRSKQLQLLLLSQSFEPIVSTTFPVCGKNVGREGEGWCIARKSRSNKIFDPIMASRDFDLYESPQDLKKILDEHDKKLNFDIHFKERNS